MLLVVRLSVVALGGAGMVILGWDLLGLFTPLELSPRAYLFAPVLSSVLWVPLSFVLRRASMAESIGVGLVSPFVGSVVLCPPYGWLFALFTSHVAVPVGLVTGMVIKLAAHTDDFVRILRVRRRMCPHCRYDLKGLPSNPICPECGNQTSVRPFRPAAFLLGMEPSGAHAVISSLVCTSLFLVACVGVLVFVYQEPVTRGPPAYGTLELPALIVVLTLPLYGVFLLLLSSGPPPRPPRV